MQYLDKPEFIVPPIVRLTRNSIQRQIYSNLNGNNNDERLNQILFSSTSSTLIDRTTSPSPIGHNLTVINSKFNNFIIIDAVDGDDEIEISFATRSNPSQVTYLWSQINLINNQQQNSKNRRKSENNSFVSRDDDDVVDDDDDDDDDDIDDTHVNDDLRERDFTLNRAKSTIGSIDSTTSAIEFTDVQLVNSQRIILSGSSLFIKSLDRHIDSGLYSIVATNTQGSTNITFYLNVLGELYTL